MPTVSPNSCLTHRLGNRPCNYSVQQYLVLPHDVLWSVSHLIPVQVCLLLFQSDTAAKPARGASISFTSGGLHWSRIMIASLSQQVANERSAGTGQDPAVCRHGESMRLWACSSSPKALINPHPGGRGKINGNLQINLLVGLVFKWKILISVFQQRIGFLRCLVKTFTPLELHPFFQEIKTLLHFTGVLCRRVAQVHSSAYF